MILDIIVIALIILAGFIGYKRGMVKIVFGIVSFLLALIIAFIIYKPVSDFIIQKTTIDEKIQDAVIEKLVAEEKEENNITILDEVKNNTIKASAEEVSTLAVRLISLLAVFLITKLLLLFVKGAITLIASLPLIKQLNEVGGAVAGLLQGVIVIYVILAIILLISDIVNVKELVETINGTILTKTMYENNVLINLIK